MSKTVDRDAVLADIDQAFKAAGYRSTIKRKPTDSFTGVVATIDEGDNRRRTLVVTSEDEIGSLRVQVSRLHSADVSLDCLEREGIHDVIRVAGAAGVGEDIVRRSRDAALLLRTGDPSATPAELYEALDFIADPKRNSSSLGNPRGDDIAALARAVRRLLTYL